MGRTELKGFLGWLFWSVVHIYFLVGARNRIAVSFAWMWNYLTFQRSARLITLEHQKAAGGSAPAEARVTPPAPAAGE